MRCNLISKILKIPNEIYFYAAWILMEFKICVANSSMSNLDFKFISYICLALFIIKIITTKYNFKEAIVAMLLVCICSIITFNCGDSRVLWFALVISASKNINFNKIVKISFITMLSCVVLFLICFIFGLTSGIQNDYVKGIRFNFGLGHPNMFSMYYNILLAHLIYLRFNKIKVSHIIIFSFIATLIFFLSKSVTGFIVYLFIFASLFIYNDKIFKTYKIKDYMKRCFPIVVVFGILVFSILPLFYTDNEFFRKIDYMFTGRFSQANYYYCKYGISLFGSNVIPDLQSPSTGAILDIGYTRMLIHNGIIYYYLVTISSIITMFKLNDDKKYPLLVMVISMIICMYTENVLTYIFMNVSMLYFGSLIFMKSGEYNEKFKNS